MWGGASSILGPAAPCQGMEAEGVPSCLSLFSSCVRGAGLSAAFRGAEGSLEQPGAAWSSQGSWGGIGWLCSHSLGWMGKEKVIKTSGMWNNIAEQRAECLPRACVSLGAARAGSQ